MSGYWQKIANAVLFTALLVAIGYLIYAPSPLPLVTHGKFTSTKAEVVEVDNSDLDLHGIFDYGTQHLKVKLPDGRVADADNEMRAQLEYDKKFKVGDVALVVLPDSINDDNSTLLARDHWRIGWMSVLFIAFASFLCVFGGWIGVRSLFTFFFSCLAIWKLLVPAVLSGGDPALITFSSVAFLTAVIVFLVAGISRKGVSAFCGSMLGVVASLFLSKFFSSMMYVDGANMPAVQQLIYSMSVTLDLSSLFIGAVILSSSGAMMDLAMDIAAGIDEVVRHNPQLKFKQLFFSGCRIGRAVVGTMITTLLLAYSGGYITLLMVFAAEGTDPIDFINTTLVGSEIVKTLVGSFGLVLVAPFTALSTAIIYGLNFNALKKSDAFKINR